MKVSLSETYPSKKQTHKNKKKILGTLKLYSRCNSVCDFLLSFPLKYFYKSQPIWFPLYNLLGKVINSILTSAGRGVIVQFLQTPGQQLFWNPLRVYFKDWIGDQAERWVKPILGGHFGSRIHKIVQNTYLANRWS